MMKKLKKIQTERVTKYKAEDGYGIDLNTFKESVSLPLQYRVLTVYFSLIVETKELITRAFTSQFIIPDFKSFTEKVTDVFHECEGTLCYIL